MLSAGAALSAVLSAVVPAVLSAGASEVTASLVAAPVVSAELLSSLPHAANARPATVRSANARPHERLVAIGRGSFDVDIMSPITDIAGAGRAPTPDV